MTESIVLGAGCFWCSEAAYQRIKGVATVVPGYAGGHTVNPTYQEVAGQQTGHAEVVKVDFDPDIISLAEILEVFWVIHDPTTPDRQGNDIGPAYRSIILYKTPQQREVANDSIKSAQHLWDDPIITELKELETFYPAEVEHQDYYNQNQDRNPYCQVVINPKLQKLRERFSERLSETD